MYEGSIIRGNDVSRNGTGIAVGNGASALSNRVYANSLGMYTRDGSRLEGNVVYSNATGIENNDYSVVRGNLVYGNTTRGILVSSIQGAGYGVFGNTVYQTAGDAITVSGGWDVNLRDNILAVTSGNAINVAAGAQDGFSSDYNLFWATGAGRIALWGARTFDALNDWALEIGVDAESLATNPQFVGHRRRRRPARLLDRRHRRGRRDGRWRRRLQHGRRHGPPRRSPEQPAATTSPLTAARTARVGRSRDSCRAPIRSA